MLDVHIVKYGKFSNSRADKSDSSGPISSIIEIIQSLMVTYILTNFGDDWLIFVDARVLTRKLWTDGHRRTVGLKKNLVVMAFRIGAQDYRSCIINRPASVRIMD